MARPIATAQTAGAFLGGLRVMAIDGTPIDVADPPENDQAWGRPRTTRGAGAFPQRRVLALIATGPHVIGEAVIRPCGTGAVPTARRRRRAVGPGRRLVWDRGFHSDEWVQPTLKPPAHCLGRTTRNRVLRPTARLAAGSFLARSCPSPPARRRDEQGSELRGIEAAVDTPAGPGPEQDRLLTALVDAQPVPAERLAATDHERWAIETALDEVKLHPWAHPRPLRSQHPRAVVPDVSGRLLAPLASRTVLAQAALHDGVDPDRLRFTGALRVLRRAIPRAPRTPPARRPWFALAG